MIPNFKQDIQALLEKDPATNSWLEAVLCSPGLHALWLHRIAHWLWTHEAQLPARILGTISRALSGIEIHPGAQIGQGVVIDHGMGVVIGETAEIGDGCLIYQGVALGGTANTPGVKRHPTLGKNVLVGSGAKILGPVTIGDNTKIGANAVVTKSLPANVTAVGVPARILERVVENIPQMSNSVNCTIKAPGEPEENEFASSTGNLPSFQRPQPSKSGKN